jgi:hypothetical protein
VFYGASQLSLSLLPLQITAAGTFLHNRPAIASRSQFPTAVTQVYSHCFVLFNFFFLLFLLSQ